MSNAKPPNKETPVGRVMRRNCVKAIVHLRDAIERIASNVDVISEEVSNPAYIREQATRIITNAAALAGCVAVLSAMKDTGSEIGDLVNGGLNAHNQKRDQGAAGESEV